MSVKIVNYLIILTGVILGVLCGRWLMLFGIGWDKSFEKCCLGNTEFIAVLDRVSYAPVLGAVLGVLLAGPVVFLISWLKKSR
jgi:hypothetical protein